MHGATLLDLFLSVARNDQSCNDIVLECESEQWTYEELDIISSALATELNERFGRKIIVASICENHPLILAFLLATWKLGGAFAPLDPHAPPEMLRHMLQNINPSCAIIPDNAESTRSLTEGMGIETFSFELKNSTVTRLAQRYMHHVRQDLGSVTAPSPQSVAVYIYTSSASSISNLKCVPVAHGVLARGSQARVKWAKQAWPDTDFRKLRVLGWAPWSHMMAISHDLGAATFSTGGCYVFGVRPPGFPATRTPSPTKEGVANGVANLLDSLLHKPHDVLIGVPWMLEGFISEHEELVRQHTPESLRKAKLIEEALSNLKYLGLGGAQASREALSWATTRGVHIYQFVGMTELGGSLFMSKITMESLEDKPLSLGQCIIDDAELSLIGSDGVASESEGELVITSSLINSGYLNYDSTAFSQTSDGRVTFRTGDIYSRTSDMSYEWKGRKEDYIQTVTGETLDPRPIENILKSCPSIVDCCIVGNCFLNAASDFVCAIIQPKQLESQSALSKQMSEITRAMAAVNRTLPPSLRIPWSRVLLIGEAQKIPRTKKGAIFRKKLEEDFGSLLSSHLSLTATGNTTFMQKAELKKSDSPQIHNAKGWTKDTVIRSIMVCISEVLSLSTDIIRANSDMSFAELGMDSAMALRIVNQLNKTFALQLPQNTCHTYVDFGKLSDAVLAELGLQNAYKVSHVIPSEVAALPQANRVVIVGRALRLPGDINTPESFWDALINKRDIITDVPADRWDHASFYRSPTSGTPPQTGDINFAKAGWVDVAHYDNTFFGISAPEAMYVGPSIRLTLETAFEALENACIPVSKVRGTNMGVFLGTAMDIGYHQLLYDERGYDIYTRFYGTGMASSTACGRISYLLDIHGPSTTTDTACSSGMVAFDQAVRYLQSGSGESAIVGAASAHLSPGSFGFLSAQKMASPNSRCATFTDMADGYVPSEGCVVFILKTEAAALRDGDNILAVVKSTDVMHGGKSQGLVAPNVHTQVNLQSRLLNKAGLNASDIDFLETHGTGTALGDLIEIQGINQVFRGSHFNNPLILGAAKSCIGHTEFAAGLVGILKAVASFEHASVPGLMHLNETNLNPSIDCNAVPLLIPHETVPLPQNPHDPHRALILANGFSGTVAGAVLEAPTRPPSVKREALENITPEISNLPTLFVVSAKSPEALHEYIRRYLRFCRMSESSSFHNICYTSCVGREHYRYRFVCVVAGMEELILALEERLRAPSLNSNAAPAPSVVFAFPGQGSHYFGMASGVAERFPNFSKHLNKAASAAENLSGYPIQSLLLGHGSFDSQIWTEAAQICIYVYQYSVATWLKELGVTPYGVVGHSLGEIAGAVIAGALTYEIGLELTIRRAVILKSTPEHAGGMAIVAASQEIVTQLIREQHLDAELVIAVFNSLESHVVSGTLDAVHSFVSRAKADGLRATVLDVSQAFHSPLIWPSLPSLQDWVVQNQKQFSELEMKFYSTVRGAEISASGRLPPFYWVEHARDPVKFLDAACAILCDGNIDVILDIGPQPFIWTTLQNIPHQKRSITTSTKPSKDPLRTFLSALASLFTWGVTLNFEELWSGYNLSKVPIPSYPFQRRRFFPDHVPSRNKSSSRSLAAPSISESKIDDIKQLVIDLPLYELLINHKIEGRRVLPGAALVDFYALQSPFKAVQSITFHEPMVVEAVPIVTLNECDAKSGKFSLKLVEAAIPETPVICSGTTALQPIIPAHRELSGMASYEDRRDHSDVYDSHTMVEFGPVFRNIQEIKIWPTHADSHITVKSSLHPTHDRIRKLDCCLHGIGAVVLRQVPQTSRQKGSFLPTSLHGFALHSDELPESFICRYYLPLEVTRNYHVISTSFDVISPTGSLLISCAKYTLAWLSAGSAVQKRELGVVTTGLQWYHQSWIPRPILHPPSAYQFRKYERLLYIGHRGSHLADLMSRYAQKVHDIYLSNPEDDADLYSDTSLESRFKNIYSDLGGSPLSVILDTSAARPAMMPSYSHDVLALMKLLLNHKVNIVNFTLISVLAVSTAGHFPLDMRSAHTAPSTASVVQGMLKVFRRETGLDSQIWALDFPYIDKESAHDIILRELHERQISRLGSSDRVVAYRPMEEHGGLQRNVPVLLHMPAGPEVSGNITGTTVIVGMGSIGCALAKYLIARQTKVVFIGRRPFNDTEVQSSFSSVNGQGKCFYMQADVNEVESLRCAIMSITSTHGDIVNIIHTAAVVRDATIQNMDEGTFDMVTAPKVTGAWYLHLVTSELCPSLKSFTMLSSISVSLGNQGQIAYVAGNYYMEALASYRQERNLPAKCIQLGAWESRLVEAIKDNKQSPVLTTSHDEGIPYILKAISASQTIQVLAELNIDAMVATEAYSLDPFFQEILPKKVPTEDTGAVNALDELIDILRSVLELQPSENLETADTLTAQGIDSIAFAQIRGRVMHQLGVEVPVKFLADTFTLQEMMDHIVAQYTSRHEKGA